VKDSGYVYIFSLGELIKIGKSINPIKRISALSVPVEHAFIGKTNKMSEIERFLHDKYFEYHHGLEWFKKDCFDLVKKDITDFTTETEEIFFTYRNGRSYIRKKDKKTNNAEIDQFEFDKMWRREKVSIAVFESSTKTLKAKLKKIGLCNGCEYLFYKDEDECLRCTEIKRKQLSISLLEETNKFFDQFRVNP